MVTQSRFIKYIVAAFLAVFSPMGGLQAQQVPSDPVLEGLFAELKDADEATHARLAERIVNRWSKSGSASMDLLYRRGEEALEEGDAQAAVEHFTALVDHAPDFAEGYHGRASAYFTLDLIGPALDDLRQTLVLNPRHFDALFGLGIIMETLERPDDAREVYAIITEIYPLDPDALAAIARLELDANGQSL